jgi:hypothetical protein
MMKRPITLMLRSLAFGLLLAGYESTGSAQDEVKRPPLRVPEVADTALQLVPPGWRIEGNGPEEVDLNGDGKPDAAFVISHGGISEPGHDQPVVVKHVLVLALRGADGKLHRSIVSDAAVLDGDEGGAFGDPFDSLVIENDTVAIMHYGGSNDRWNYTHRYRYQSGQWMLVGLDFGNTESTNPEHFDSHSINLLTGGADASERSEDAVRLKKPEVSGSYFELEALPVDKPPSIDGIVGAGEWPGYTARLYRRYQVYRNRQLWRGADDLSAQLHAVRLGKDLFVLAEVTDNEVTATDAVRLVTQRGFVVKPLASKLAPGGKGYIFEARYSLETIVKATRPFDRYAVTALRDHLDSTDQGRDLEGFELPVAVEIIDVDRSAPTARGILSTRLVGSPYNGAIRIFRKGTLVLVSDVGQ